MEERGRTVIASGSVGDLAVETAVSAGDDVFLLEVIKKTSKHSERIPVLYSIFPFPEEHKQKLQCRVS